MTLFLLSCNNFSSNYSIDFSKVLLFYSRAVFQPFKAKLTSICIMVTCVVILTSSVLMQVFRCMKYSCYRKIFYINGISVYARDCGVTFSTEEKFLEPLIKFTLGIYLPMIIVIVCHVAMYVKLRQQARFRAESMNNNDSTKIQMQNLSRKFLLIVCVFYICMLPGTIIWLHFTYLMYTKQMVHWDKKYYYEIGVDISWAVLNMSCCLNPFIYGQLHAKMLGFIRKKIAC